MKQFLFGGGKRSAKPVSQVPGTDHGDSVFDFILDIDTTSPYMPGASEFGRLRELLPADITDDQIVSYLSDIS